VDAANDLYVATEFGGVNGLGQLNVFGPGGTSPQAVISGPGTGLDGPHAVAVAPPMSIATSSLPVAAVGRRYSARLYALLGRPQLSWRVVRGHLPAGLRLSRSGYVSGVPRRIGDASFTVKLIGPSDRYPSTSRKLRLTVAEVPTVSAVTPVHGAASGGALVTIHGVGFATGLGSTIVDFGRYAAPMEKCISHICTARAPIHPQGIVAVRVTANGLTSAPTRSDRFTYRR
jgi:IPT/TIG domain